MIRVSGKPVRLRNSTCPECGSKTTMRRKFSSKHDLLYRIVCTNERCEMHDSSPWFGSMEQAMLEWGAGYSEGE